MHGIRVYQMQQGLFAKQERIWFRLLMEKHMTSTCVSPTAALLRVNAVGGLRWCDRGPLLLRWCPTSRSTSAWLHAVTWQSRAQRLEGGPSRQRSVPISDIKRTARGASQEIPRRRHGWNVAQSKQRAVRNLILHVASDSEIVSRRKSRQKLVWLKNKQTKKNRSRGCHERMHICQTSFPVCHSRLAPSSNQDWRRRDAIQWAVRRAENLGWHVRITTRAK